MECCSYTVVVDVIPKPRRFVVIRAKQAGRQLIITPAVFFLTKFPGVDTFQYELGGPAQESTRSDALSALNHSPPFQKEWLLTLIVNRTGTRTLCEMPLFHVSVKIVFNTLSSQISNVSLGCRYLSWVILRCFLPMDCRLTIYWIFNAASHRGCSRQHRTGFGVHIS